MCMHALTPVLCSRARERVTLALSVEAGLVYELFSVLMHSGSALAGRARAPLHREPAQPAAVF
eukprot:4227445-Pleurochrysis_carterae.AAC.1